MLVAQLMKPPDATMSMVTAGGAPSTWPLTVSPEADLRVAAQRMLDAHVQSLVVAAGDHVVGVISKTDIAWVVARGQAW